MQFQIGDRIKDETEEWQVIGRPYTTAGGKNAHVRVQRVGQSGGVKVRTWGARAPSRAPRGPFAPLPLCGDLSTRLSAVSQVQVVKLRENLETGLRVRELIAFKLRER
ncbi:MAG: hypothetical protein DMD96_20815 [Candidatus Rokuibacteriota bacterium]|nr:MAG: hypothetical protein DMD96_20815 [Candidatus Rokubacteria bacterium]